MTTDIATSMQSIRISRLRRIGLSISLSVLARGTGMLITIITVPLTLNYLGNQRFAVWTILSSIASLLAFADLGIGNSLINLIAKADADNDRATAQRYVSSSFFTLSFLALLLGIGFAIFLSDRTLVSAL